MSHLPENRTTANTPTEHVADHNEVHRLHNLFDGTSAADFQTVAQKGAASGYVPLDSSSVIPVAYLPAGLGTWTALGNLATPTTLVGDVGLGTYTNLGNIGTSVTLTG